MTDRTDFQVIRDALEELLKASKEFCAPKTALMSAQALEALARIEDANKVNHIEEANKNP